jgi:peptide/nickel transport system permease protein
VVRERLPATLLLAAVAIVVAVTTAVPLGVVAALFPRSPVDRAARLMSLTGIAVPSFVSGPLLVWIFAIELGWLPVSGNDGPAHVVLPALTLALGMSGLLVRLTRAAMLDTMTADHLRTARAKGAGATRVVLVHALRVALPPIVTVVGLQAGALLAGAVVTETIFAWPGVGRLVVQAIQARDYPLVQGCVLTIGLSYVGVSLLTDLLLTLVDPRLRDEP